MRTFFAWVRFRIKWFVNPVVGKFMVEDCWHYRRRSNPVHGTSWLGQRDYSEETLTFREYLSAKNAGALEEDCWKVTKETTPND